MLKNSFSRNHEITLYLHKQGQRSHKGPFNNYVDKMRGRGTRLKNVCFCPLSGYQNCPSMGGQGVKKWQNSVHVVVDWPLKISDCLVTFCPFCTATVSSRRWQDDNESLVNNFFFGSTYIQIMGSNPKHFEDFILILNTDLTFRFSHIFERFLYLRL